MALENTLIAAGEAYDVYRNYNLHRQQQLLCVSFQQKNALHHANIALVKQYNVSHLEIATLRQRNEESQRKIAELQKQIKELHEKYESSVRDKKRKLSESMEEQSGSYDSTFSEIQQLDSVELRNLIRAEGRKPYGRSKNILVMELRKILLEKSKSTNEQSKKVCPNESFQPESGHSVPSPNNITDLPVAELAVTLSASTAHSGICIAQPVLSASPQPT